MIALSSPSPLHEAVELLESGHYIAAGVLARIAMEQAMRGAVDRLGIHQPDTLPQCNLTLRRGKWLVHEDSNEVKKWFDHANRCAHGYDVQPDTIERLVEGAAKVCRWLDSIGTRKAVPA